MEVIIRPTLVEDAADMCEVFNQPQAIRETLQLPNPSLTMWQDRLTKVSTGTYFYTAEVDGKAVGNIGFQHSQQPRLRHTASFGLAVHDKYHGLGIGTKLIETVLELADNWLNIHRIQIEVNADNDKAIGLYKKLGFKVEGEAKDSSFRNGEFINTYYMARIRPK